MCSQRVRKNIPAGLRMRIQTLLFCTRGRIIEKLSGGISLDQLLVILRSLGRQLQNPPHYPVRLIRELAQELGIPFSQAQQLGNFLEKENLIYYSCAFEAKNEEQNKTVLEVNSVPGLSPTFA